MNKLYLDFETRSQTNIFDVGAYKYAMDNTTEVLCCAYALNDEPVQILNASHIHELLSLVNSETILIAHNAFFEQCIWLKLFPNNPLPPWRWRCSAAKAAAAALPRSLEGVSEALNLIITKDLEGKRVMQKLSRPRIPTKKNPSIWNVPTEEELQILWNYCKTDVEVERLVDKALPDLIPTEQKVWFLDQEINFRGIQLDLELVESAIKVFSDYSEHLIADIKNYTNGELDGASRIMAMTRYIYKRTGIILDNLQKATVDDLLKKELPSDVRKLLLARRALGKTSIKKFFTMRDSVCQDGRVRDLYMYHGASTGRFSSKLLQTQNMARGTIKNVDDCIDIIKQKDWSLIDMFFPDVGEALSSCIRGAIIAKEGHDLIVADYASIEARVLLWVAGDEEALQKYRDGVDLYCDMASAIYNRPITKDDKKERQLGKTAILGLGYGMGYNKFFNVTNQQGIETTEALAELVVAMYRKKYIKVTQLWKKLELAAKRTISTGERTQVGYVVFKKTKYFLVILLPSGRPIVYYMPKISEEGRIEFLGVNSTTKQFETQRTHGGVICENCIQAIARDLMVNGMINAEKAGYSIVMHVHDELVAEVPKTFGSVEEFCGLITKLPCWAEGLPLEAEGFRAERYKK